MSEQHVPPAPETTPESDQTTGAEVALKEELLPQVLQTPQGFEPAEIEQAQSQADSIARVIISSPDDRSALRDAASIGESVQQEANQEFTLLRTSLGKVIDRMKETGQSTSVPTDLKRLRDVMDEINPYHAIEEMKRSQTAGFFSRLLKKAPGVGRILSNIAQRYESVQTQIDSIIQSLESGADKLLENTLELEERYKSLKRLQAQVKLEAYKLGLVLQKIDEVKPTVTDPMLQQAMHKAELRLLRRVQNLKVTENAFAQFFITMNTTMDNHENLRESIRSMVDLTRPVLENGLALKIAQQDEKQIAEALSTTQDYLGGLMVQIAQDSMDNAQEIARVANQPLARFQDLVKSYQILVTRMDETQKIETQVMESARKNIAELDTMTKELEDRAEAQERGREAGSAAV